MATYKCKNTGRWRWRVRATNPLTGESRRLTGTVPRALNTAAQAAACERAAISAFMKDPATRVVAKAVPTLAEFVDSTYRPWMQASRKALSTIEGRESHLTVHILPKLGALRLTEITKPVVATWVTQLLAGPQVARGGSRKEVPGTQRAVRTVLHITTSLHSVLRQALIADWIPAIPPFPELPEIERPHPEFLDYGEADAVIAAASDPEERALFLVAIRCGLRASELKALEWSDVSFERRTLAVKRAYVRGELKPPKGRAARTLDLDEETVEALQAMRHLRRVIFSTLDGCYQSYDALERRLRRALKVAGVARHIRFHDLRHTFGSHLAMAPGNDLLIIRDLMGHKSVKTTEIYAHLMRKNGRDAIARVAKARKGDASDQSAC